MLKSRNTEQEAYAEDEFVEEEPGGEEAESKVDSDEERRNRLDAIAPDRVHVRVRTRMSQRSINRRNQSLPTPIPATENQRPQCKNRMRLTAISIVSEI